MATTMGPRQLLDISNLDEVIQLLRKHHYSQYSVAKLYDLGLSLGLLAPTLETIKANNVNDVHCFLRECLSAWLRQADGVKSKGGPTYVTFIAALKSIGEKAVADAIDIEKHPACMIFTDYHSTLLQSIQCPVVRMAELLHKEKVLSEEAFVVVKSTRVSSSNSDRKEALLKAVQEAVCSNHQNLETFVNLLRQEDSAAVPVADDILREYDHCFTDKSEEKFISDEDNGSFDKLSISLSSDTINRKEKKHILSLTVDIGCDTIYDGSNKEMVQNEEDSIRRKSLELSLQEERKERQELTKEVQVLSNRLQVIEAQLLKNNDPSTSGETHHLNASDITMGLSPTDTVSKRLVQEINTTTVNQNDQSSVGDLATASMVVCVKGWRNYSVGGSTREVMIIGSFGEWPLYTHHKSPMLIPSDLDISSDQWKREEIDSIRKLYQKNPEEYPLRFVCYDLPGTEHSKEYYLEMIKDLFINCKQPGVIIYYTGHGERKTGNWCFKDGVISFQDIFGLYMNHLKGKSLVIISDCSYSGNWINECIKKLDEIGIPSCGHHTRKQGVLLKIFTSCKPNEEATAMCCSKEAVEYNEGDKGVYYWYRKKLTSGQTTMCTDFRDIYCSKPAAESCEIDSTCRWEDRLGNKYRLIYLVRGEDRNQHAWYYVLVDEDKLDEFRAKIATGTINVADYGKVLHSGLGKDPPKDIVRKVDYQFLKYINP